ncbi:MAG: diguanylate cyclase [Planctomycetota bacterium]
MTPHDGQSESAARGLPGGDSRGRATDVVGPGGAGSDRIPIALIAAEVAAEFIFREVDDPMYVMDLETGRYLAVNPAFCRVTGHSEDDLLSGRIRVDDLVVNPDGHPGGKRYRKRTQALGIKDDDSSSSHAQLADQLYHVMLRTASGELQMQEVSIKHATYNDRRVTLGCMRDITPVVKRQEELESETRKQREKTKLTFQANVRIMQLTERIIKTPEFTRHIEDCEDTETMCRRACEYLVSSRGMEFAHAAIYAWNRQHNGLKLREGSPAPSWPESVPPDASSHPLMQVAQGHTAWVDDSDGDVAVPLRVGDRRDGVLAIRYHTTTRQLLESEPAIRKSLRDVVVTLGDLIGSRANNLTLLDRVRMLTIVDQLTGVYNRRYFDEKLAAEVHRTARYGRELTLMLLDIDRFKTINDTWLHTQGDQMLTEFGELLRQNTRTTDIICRLGGDEFAILFIETGLESAIQKAESLRTCVLKHHFQRKHPEAPDPLQITISIGLAAWANSWTAAELYGEADAALYDSKRGGRDRVTVRR